MLHLFDRLGLKADLRISSPQGEVTIVGDSPHQPLRVSFSSEAVFRYMLQTWSSQGGKPLRAYSFLRKLKKTGHRLQVYVANQELIAIGPNRFFIAYRRLLPFASQILFGA